MKSIFTIILLAFSIHLFSAPFNGKIMSFRQPDGTSVDVRLYGDEYYIRAEGLDGFTVVREKNSQWICMPCFLMTALSWFLRASYTMAKQVILLP